MLSVTPLYLRVYIEETRLKNPLITSAALIGQDTPVQLSGHKPHGTALTNYGGYGSFHRCMAKDSLFPGVHNTDRYSDNYYWLVEVCEVPLGGTPVSLRRFTYKERSRCYSLVCVISCADTEDSSFIPFLHNGRLNLGSCLALRPLVSVDDTPPKQYKYDPNTMRK